MFQKYLTELGEVKDFDYYYIMDNWPELISEGFLMSTQEDPTLSWYIFVANLLADSISESFNTLKSLTL